MDIICLNRVSKTFKKGNESVEALKGIDFTLKEKEFVYITGRSGSGKSTLLNIMGLLERPDLGEVFFNNSYVNYDDCTLLTHIRRNTIGFIFQELYLQDHLTAAENAALPLKYSGVNEKERLSRAKNILGELGLSNRQSFHPYELSGGEQQRVAIARALINEPQVILADEPTSELDTETSINMISILKEKAKEKCISVVVVTHDNVIQKFADKVYIMQDGLLKDQN